MDAAVSNYIARVSRIDSLAQDEEKLLARRWREQGDARARNRLVEAHLGFVLQIARAHYRTGISLSELIAEGNLGLLYALNKFDPERGFRFVTYAKHWVRVYVSECAIRSRQRVFRDSRTLRKVRVAYQRACAFVGEGLPAREIAAKRLGMELLEFDRLINLCDQRRIPLEFGDEENLFPDCFVESSHFPGPEEALCSARDRSVMCEAVRCALQDLSARERSIVERRLMADTETQQTLLELGGEFGVSRERVRQIEARLKQKLRERLLAYDHTDSLGRAA